MPVPRGRPKKVKPVEAIPIFATESQIKSVQQDIRDLEIMLAEDRQRKVPLIQDVIAVKADIIKKQQYILRNTPSLLKGDAANRAYKEAKALEAIIKEKMPSANKYHQPYPKGETSHLKQQKFEDAVRQQIAFQTNPVIQQAVLKFKSIMARLDPQNPMVRNIERLRNAR